jgi:hypothetical protein
MTMNKYVSKNMENQEKRVRLSKMNHIHEEKKKTNKFERHCCFSPWLGLSPLLSPPWVMLRSLCAALIRG